MFTQDEVALILDEAMVRLKPLVRVINLPTKIVKQASELVPEFAVSQYNWGYLDGWEHDIDLRTFWIFMLWRLHTHGNTGQLIEEVITAFPDLLLRCPEDDYLSSSQLLGTMIESRFIKRFLEFWGFVTVAPMRYIDDFRTPDKVEIQPLMRHVFQFDV